MPGRNLIDRLLGPDGEPGWRALEKRRDGKVLVVRADLRGLDRNTSVDVFVADGVLHVHPDRRSEDRARAHDPYWSVLRSGRFRHTVALPPGASTEAIQTSYVAGVLEVRIPVDPDQPEPAFGTAMVRRRRWDGERPPVGHAARGTRVTITSIHGGAHGPDQAGGSGLPRQ